jgi:hypothetical protein
MAFLLAVLNSTCNTLSQFACAQAYMKVYASTNLHFNRKMKLLPNKTSILCLQRKPLGSSNVCGELMWSHMASTADIKCLRFSVLCVQALVQWVVKM